MTGAIVTFLLVGLMGEPTQALVGQEFDLRVGKTMAIAGEGLTVEFVTVVEDSRCPADTTCFWEGDAVVRLAVRKSKAPPLTTDLHSSAKFSREAQFQKYRIRLTRVAPIRHDSSPISPSAYTITLVVFAD